MRDELAVADFGYRISEIPIFAKFPVDLPNNRDP
jgi:hypothetical protein